MSTLSKEIELCVRVPNYVDRLASLGKSEGVGRWFPYAYEIIIMQWAAVLLEQRASGDGNSESKAHTPFCENDTSLTEAAARTGGVIIACAPVLFEIIKQSLAWRVSTLFRNRLKFDVFKESHVHACSDRQRSIAHTLLTLRPE